MMSLVAYDASSDEEDDCDDENLRNSLPEVSLFKNNSNSSTSQIPTLDTNGYISDEEDNFNTNCGNIPSTSEKITKKGLHLPVPKNVSDESCKTEESAKLPIHLNLPAPKTSLQAHRSFDIIEEDDEFLHKKEIAPPIEKPQPPKKQPVKITIPSLNQFMDFKVENKKESNTNSAKKTASLLAILPDPQNENVFHSQNTENLKRSTTTKVTNLIPDHVKNKNKVKIIKDSSIINKQHNLKKPDIGKSLESESEESDEEENKDFFSLNTKIKLPEVSESEIKAMVEKKVAEMTQGSKKIDEMVKLSKNQIETPAEAVVEKSTTVDKFALQALVGASQAKRKKIVEEAQIVEISSEQVLPNRDEWMRASLTAETSYQPRGLLVDEEPAPGTRKKHQITYLAHQAKANEAELQAMWAANRQNRRAAASKYGF